MIIKDNMANMCAKVTSTYMELVQNRNLVFHLSFWSLSLHKQYGKYKFTNKCSILNLLIISLVCYKTQSAKEFEWQKAIKDLKTKIDSLTKELEKEQEWKPYVDENAFSDKAYANIANNGTPPVSDKEAVQFISEHFGFDKTKITIRRMKPIYEINRHQQVRQIGSAVRNPYIFASDWNYICFSSMGTNYEIQNGTIFPYI